MKNRPWKAVVIVHFLFSGGIPVEGDDIHDNAGNTDEW
jgi:hypothetical protein